MAGRSASEIVDQAIAEWASGAYYEAHETLEDFAEALEANDVDHQIALALVRVAASLHKAREDVGRTAVPGKLREALETLDRAPADWRGLDVGGLRGELHALLGAIGGMATGAAVGLPAVLPVLRRKKT